jgi:hypothetical protein
MSSPSPPASSFGPLTLMPWADLGLRTWDAMLSTGQEMSDQADRLARAQSSAEPALSAAAPALNAQAMTLANPALAAMAQWQGVAFQWMSQAWQQWFSLMGALQPLAARGAAGPGSALASPLSTPQDLPSVATGTAGTTVAKTPRARRPARKSKRAG